VIARFLAFHRTLELSRNSMLTLALDAEVRGRSQACQSGLEPGIGPN